MFQGLIMYGLKMDTGKIQEAMQTATVMSVNCIIMFGRSG